MSVRKRKKRLTLDVEDEKLYLFFADKVVDRTEEGIKQFVLYCSNDIKPENPDPYFLALQSGRKWFFWQQEELRKSYGTDEWFGWYQLKKDWEDNLWILDRLTAWKKHSFDEMKILEL